METNKQLTEMRHSCAHLMAAAIQAIWPKTKFGVGPVIENGFYYDFDLEHKLSEADFEKIEAKMKELAEQGLGFEQEEVSIKEAKKRMTDAGQTYKVELIEQIEKTGTTDITDGDQGSSYAKASEDKSGNSDQKKTGSVTFYKTGDFVDLCRGGHVDNTKEIGPSKLLSAAGAYWRGKETNPMMQRIYGTCWQTQKELDDYLKLLEEAKARDHKRLGKELDLFVFSETVGKGLPLWTPKGSTLRRILERFIVDEELKRGYLHVYTPDIANLALYQKSGHYPYYKESMYAPITIDDEQYMLRPMTCPHHFELYLSRPHSYRELPMRIAELAKLYRYEKSGELMGLQRVRTFCLADAHIIARPAQAETIINEVLDLIDYLASTFGLMLGENYWYRLSLGARDNDKKYYKDDEAWDTAEACLRSVLNQRKAHFVEAPDEAAFYGPKIDIQMRNVNGKEDTAFTVQYDFVMPKRFNLIYTNEVGAEEQPIVIHRSSIGAIERVVAFLIEHFAGKFPLWLSPVQIKILPIADRHNEYAEKVERNLAKLGYRTELDLRTESIGKKIRAAELEKVPYMLIIGDKEIETKCVSIRAREQGDLGQKSIHEFDQLLKQAPSPIS